MEVSNTAIKLEKIHFDKDTIEELNRFAKNYKMKVTYYYGYIVEFDKVNVYAISPHKIVFTKYGYNLLVLRYVIIMQMKIYSLYQKKKTHLQLVL